MRSFWDLRLGDAAAHAALGLHALQHRGQEAAGIVAAGNGHFHAHRELGLVGDIFGEENVIKQLEGTMAIGHTRYSTTGRPNLRNVQPLFADLEFGGFAVAHNGNLTNAVSIREELVCRGCIFQSTTDTEIIIHLMATSSGTVIDRMVDALRQVDGAYSIVAVAEDCVIGCRDPHGVRPLVLGRLGDAYLLASESCAFDIVGAVYVRDIDPGEMVVLNGEGVHSHRPFPPAPQRFCIFEYIYFSRPDSVIEAFPSIRHVSASAGNWRVRHPLTQILLFRCQILGSRPRSDMHMRRPFLMRWALSGITTWGAHLSNRLRRFATLASS